MLSAKPRPALPSIRHVCSDTYGLLIKGMLPNGSAAFCDDVRLLRWIEKWSFCGGGTSGLDACPEEAMLPTSCL